MTDAPPILARIRPNPVRRAMAAGFPAVLGLLLVAIAAGGGVASAFDLAFLLLTGLSALAFGVAVWRSTAPELELTRDELRERGGRVLCRIEDVARVERGFFVMKPAGGFVLILASRHPRAFAPGLWWRRGRRLMVGGATTPSESKAMAEVIHAMLAAGD
ncbi:hypothetical protein HKCCE2091_07290 [Rhodobacterales bacterium HKCCE2091]|nr:hypothetical protein [Rhodobacterales bacterium HKCCE2091]